MAKRKSLTFDSKGLSDDLKASTGQGIDALFSPPPTAITKVKSIEEPEISSPHSAANDSAKKNEMKPTPSHAKSSRPETKTASRNLDSYISRYLDRNLDIYLDYLRPLQNASGAQVNLNYPQELVDKLEDLIFELNRLQRKKKRKQKVTKTKVLVAALAYFIWDYEANKDKSILHNLIEKENE